MTPFPSALPASSRLADSLRRRLPRRSPQALVLAALLAGAAARLAVIAAFSPGDRVPAWLGAALAVAALAMAAATVVLGDRLPRWAFAAQVVAAVVLDSVIVAAAAGGAGVLARSFAYAWLMVYVALFFPGAVAWFAVVVAVAFGAAVLATGLPGLLGGWILVTFSTAAVGLVLGRLSRSVQGHLRTDGLTGALNRGGLDTAAERIDRGGRNAEAVTVAVLDLDSFKAVNDRLGHAGGDRLLTEATGAWRGALRGDDVLARTGGDEFVLVMPRTPPEQAEAVLDRLRRAHAVQWSAGVTRWRPGEPIDACIARADELLYAAKSARRDAPGAGPERSSRRRPPAGSRIDPAGASG